LQLSEPEEIKLRQELAELEPETSMPYVTSFERFARQEGREEGLRQAVREVMLTRFGEIPESVAQALERCSDGERLREWLRVASSRPSLAVVASDLGLH
jgi:hypothetical protein